MRHTLPALALGALLLLDSGSASAGEPLQWENPGPFGGFIFRVQVDETDPDRVLVLTTRGNFISADRGESFRPVKLSSQPYLDPCFVAISGGGLRMILDGVLAGSMDGGDTWKPDRKLPGRLVGGVRDAGDPEKTTWVGVEEDETTGTTVHVLSPGREARRIGTVPGADYRVDQRLALQAHSADPRELVLLLPIYDKGLTYLFSSEDGGDTWKRWAVPLVLNAVAPVPGKPGEWLGASLPIEGKLSGLVRSVNGGRTWVEIGEDSRLRMIRTLIFHPGTGALLLGSFSEGVLESPDQGKTLIERGEGLGIDNICSIAVDPRVKERIYAGTQSGLYRSEDGGRSWKWASRGLTALQCTGLTSFPDNRILLVEYQQGIRSSTDGGRTWPAFTPGWKERHGKPYWPIVLGDVLVAPVANREANTVVSLDAGQTWSPCGLSEGQWAIGVLGPSCIIAADRDGSILRSRTGDRFVKVFGPVARLSGHLQKALRLSENQAVVFSATQCASFDPATYEVGAFSALPETSLPTLAMVDPVHPGVVWLPTEDGCLHRRAFPDGEWECRIERQGDRFLTMVADPGKKHRRIACFGDGALMISEDAGEHWAPLETPQRFAIAKGMVVTADRRLLVAANGSVRVLDLASLDD